MEMPATAMQDDGQPAQGIGVVDVGERPAQGVVVVDDDSDNEDVWQKKRRHSTRKEI